MKTKKGRKPILDKKKLINLFIRQSVIDANGGKDELIKKIYKKMKIDNSYIR